VVQPDAVAWSSLVARLRARLAVDGLHIVLPISADGFDRELAAVGGPRLGDLLDGAEGAFVVADGGPEFFGGFRREGSAGGGAEGGGPGNPLDDHTRRCVAGAVSDTLALEGGRVRHRIVYPFDAAGAAPLPFQRLGRAAGLPEAGPLGLQIHPQFGPWWAYRGLVITAGTSLVFQSEPPLAASCPGCRAPCAAACPAEAVDAAGEFHIARCAAHRLAEEEQEQQEECARSCAARSACPVGVVHRYPDAQLAYHMTASLTQIRRWSARATSA
jgi:epoxyqueuosine reductase